MVLMIDNYDSFTFNLVQYFGELGAQVRVVRNDAMTVEEAVALEPAALVVSPGPCAPQQAGISLALIARLAGKVPILGVCLGHPAAEGDRRGLRRPGGARQASNARQGVARAP
jgi:anthranilate synthase component II